MALAVLTGLAVRRGVLGPRDQTAAVGGPFQLVDQTGRTVDQDVLKGKWSAVFFGYTHGPDICPTTLFEFGQVEPMLGARAKDFQSLNTGVLFQSGEGAGYAGGILSSAVDGIKVA